MNVQKSFFSVQVESHDLVLVSVMDSPRPHVFRAKVEHIYSYRNGIVPEHLGADIEFYSGPTSWGNVPLKVGERALLFVRNLSGILNEYPWRGHMVLTEVNDDLYASVQTPELWLRDDLPAAVRAVSRSDPTKRNYSLVRFSVLEIYLKELIDGVERNRDR